MTDWYKLVKRIESIEIAHNEIVATTYWKDSELKYVVTFSKTKQMYYLYEVGAESSTIKTKEKAKSPVDLEKKINIEGM